jgi:prophage antirepressor-like protein
MDITASQFDSKDIRRVYDEASETWWFSVVDVVQILIQQSDYQAARNYWKVLKNRLAKEEVSRLQVVTD